MIWKYHFSSFKRNQVQANQLAGHKITHVLDVLLCGKNIMEKRAKIEFSFKLGKKFAENYELLKKVNGDDCTSRTQVYTWFT